MGTVVTDDKTDLLGHHQVSGTFRVAYTCHQYLRLLPDTLCYHVSS